MIRYQLTVDGRPLSVILDCDRLDQSALIRFEGARADVELIESRLHVSHGRYGHLIEKETTAEDLELAMRERWLAPFRPRR